MPRTTTKLKYGARLQSFSGNELVLAGDLFTLLDCNVDRGLARRFALNVSRKKLIESSPEISLTSMIAEISGMGTGLEEMDPTRGNVD